VYRSIDTKEKVIRLSVFSDFIFLILVTRSSIPVFRSLPLNDNFLFNEFAHSELYFNYCNSNIQTRLLQKEKICYFCFHNCIYNFCVFEFGKSHSPIYICHLLALSQTVWQSISWSWFLVPRWAPFLHAV